MARLDAEPLSRWGRQAARFGVKAMAAGHDLISRPPAGITMLLYHRVGARTPSPVDLATPVFEAQVAWLREHVVLVDLDEALRRLASTDAADHEPAAVLTFDDGTSDFADQTMPILMAYGVPATLYVAADFVDQQLPFPDAGTPLSWQALADAESTGLVTVGSHTAAHLLLDRTEPDAAAADLDRSIDLIGAHLGHHPEHFAYPKALTASPAVEPAVRSRFRSAALAGTRANLFGDTDPYRLARSPIQVADPLWSFRRKVSGGMGFEDDVRARRNRRRYVDATT